MTNPKSKSTKAKRKPTKRKQGNKAPRIRTSERSTYKRCRWLWDRAYNDQLRPIRTAPALRFGTLIHAALEERYPKGVRRGPKPAETFERLFQEDMDEAERVWGSSWKTYTEEEGWEDSLGLGVSMLEEFVKEYGRDEDWQVIASEMTFQVPVPYPAHPDGGFINLKGERVKNEGVLFNYVGTMDGVWKNRLDGGIRIIDWKTTAGDPTKVSHLLLDEQATAYWTWGIDALVEQGVMKPKQVADLDGMLYTFLRKAKPDPRPKDAFGRCLNKDGSVSKVQPAPLFHRELVYRSEVNRELARERAVQEVMEMDKVKRGELAAYKNPSTGAMGHCNWCSFRDACELHEAGADWQGLLDSTTESWDPYAAHEVSEEGKSR